MGKGGNGNRFFKLLSPAVTETSQSEDWPDAVQPEDRGLNSGSGSLQGVVITKDEENGVLITTVERSREK